MKKIFSVILMATWILLLVGCSKQPDVDAPNAPAPSIVIDNQHFYAPNMPVSELPEGYVYIGVLPEEAANGTGLEGYKMYTIEGKNNFGDFYLYQECGTPIDNNTVDNTKRQWAYVHWLLKED